MIREELLYSFFRTVLGSENEYPVLFRDWTRVVVG